MQNFNPDPDHTPEDHRFEQEPDGPLEKNPLWQRDNVILASVGIDIGSAATQVLFSRLHLLRQALDLSSRYLVVERKTLFQSRVSLTPYESESLIDARALGRIVDAAYHAARMHPDWIDTGVVILTGEALRRENAERIAMVLSEKCGDLVCATAGHQMEATLAAHGSGAVKESYDRKQRLLNIDLGGGTTKLAVIDKGRILSTGAIHIGSRLIAIDSHGRLDRLEPAGRKHASRLGFSWERGDTVTEVDLHAVATSMADKLVSALTMKPPPADVTGLYLTDPVEHLQDIDAVIFSGGVAEFVYHRENRDFGDLGKALGHALRKRLDSGNLPWPMLPCTRGIRSTALGCSEFTAQLSGNTCYISSPNQLLPRRNLKVVRPVFEFTDTFSSVELADSIRRHISMFDMEPSDSDLVLAFHWAGPPRYRRLKCFADGIRLALEKRTECGQPVYVVLDADIALNLGAILYRELTSEVMVIDGLELWDFDSIDIGKLRAPSMTVPVTIKSLIFGDAMDDSRRRSRHHRAECKRITNPRSRA